MDECLFCQIVAGKVPSNKVFEDKDILAFLDINPRNPGHTLVIPKKHIETVMDMSDAEFGKIVKTVKDVVNAVKVGTSADGISIGQSNGKAAGQVIPHVHFHVIPRFNNEGPVGLEGILPVKRMDEESLKKMTETVKNSFGKKAEKREEPVVEEDLGDIKEDDFADLDFEDEL